jgi:hypothetical protein
MSKKAYKRHQNRLYREIKRRIIAEKQRLKPAQIIKCERKIETIKIRDILPDYIEQTKEYIEFVKSDMTKQIVKKLIEDDYVKFNYSSKYYRISDDEEVRNISEIEATLNVVKPLDDW